jgi:SAM-dependent methyltransferase/glycosyltransferase involved in cell wall biosynthesis
VTIGLSFRREPQASAVRARLRLAAIKGTRSGVHILGFFDMDTVHTLTECRICKSRKIVPFIQVPSVAFPGTMARYCACDDCDTVMDDGNPLVHYTESCHSCELDDALRHYLEVGAGIDSMARVMVAIHSLERKRKSGGRPRFLDIGCAFGFSCSMAQFLNWEPTGVEPTQVGVLGAKMLGVPILPAYLENTDLTPGQFDYVYSSEVIEHVQDVDAFVATAARYLKPDGVLVLTTPNGQALRGLDAVEHEWHQSLYPGYHVNVFSPASLEMVLRRNGMSSVQIILDEGSSGRKRMFVFASRSAHLPSIPWNELDIKPFIRSYLEHLISGREKLQESDSLYCGSLYRLIELLVNSGAYAEADEAIAKLDEVLTREGKPPEKYGQVQAADLKEYLSQAPAFAGLYAYYKGSVYLNHRADYCGAEKWFRIGEHLCALEGRVDPGGMYLRQHWPEKCRFHVGLAMLYASRNREALREFDVLLADAGQLPEGMQDQLRWSKAIAHLQLGENVQAGRYFADTWLHRRFADTPRELLPLLHMTQVLAQAGENRDVKLQAIENRMRELLAAQEASQEVQQRIDQQVEAIHRQYKRLATCMRPLWRLGRPVAAYLFSWARTSRNCYRWLRRGMRSEWEIGGPAIGIPAGQSHVPPIEKPLRELLADHTIEQSFTGTQHGLSALGFKFSSYHRQLSSSLKLAIYDADGQRLREVTTSASRFCDNHMHYLRFPVIADSRGKTFQLRLTTPDAAPSNGVTLWTRPGAGEGLRLDGRPARNKELVFEPIYAASDAAPSPGTRDLLLICPDHLGQMRIGIGMRHWEIARALTARGLSVTLATPHPFDSDLKGDGFPLVHVDSNQSAIALAVGHRCVMIQGDILVRFPALRDSNLSIVVDMITPMHLENFERTPKEYEYARWLLTDALARGDFFVCGNERQRLHWLGMLAGLGRLPFHGKAEHPELRYLIDLVPFGIPDVPPVKNRPVLKGVRAGIGPDDFVVTWFGGIWDWLDPVPIVRAVGAAWKQDSRIKLFFSAYRCPNGSVSQMAQRVRGLADELGLLDRCVFFNDYPVPFDERADYLLETDAGILCQARNLETQMSARTRILDYLWADCPLLINDGDEWAQTIRQHGLGTVVAENKVEQWREAILDLCGDVESRVRMRANIARIKQRLRWRDCVEPLVQFVARCRSTEPAVRLAA